MKLKLLRKKAEFKILLDESYLFFYDHIMTVFGRRPASARFTAACGGKGEEKKAELSRLSCQVMIFHCIAKLQQVWRVKRACSYVFCLPWRVLTRSRYRALRETSVRRSKEGGNALSSQTSLIIYTFSGEFTSD